MKSQKRRIRRKRRKPVILFLALGVLGVGVIGGALWGIRYLEEKNARKTPEELLLLYMEHISRQEYEEMYEMLISSGGSREEFVNRNSAIYKGIEMRNMQVDVKSFDEKELAVTYQTSFDTAAGKMSFENKAFFVDGEDGYKMVWDDSLIFPDLSASDKVRVSVLEAKRGEILDRRGHVLAGWGTASSVGIVPGRLEDWNGAVAEAARLLDMETEAIEKKLSAKWVKEDSFVPIKTIPKVNELALMSEEPEEEVLIEKERQDKLLAIPGIMISDITVREYPYGAATAHLCGYVQGVTAEDLEKHQGEGYTAGSVIGRAGMEGLFEKELKGMNGCRIYIVDAQGNEKKELGMTPVSHGQDIQLTIDAQLQEVLYEQFKEDKSCSVAMNPFTGEVLALVSTPSYNSNDFIMGLSNEKWTALNEDENKPMYNRFRQTWCPGSTFKPIIAAIGLEQGAINPNEDYGNVGKSWQKDASWGGILCDNASHI